MLYLHLDLEKDCERELNDLRGATFLVSWASLLLLLSKCRHDCCAALVNPSNMKITVKGIVATTNNNQSSTYYKYQELP